MAQIAFALHNYHEHYGSLPPAFVEDDQGRPIHSWRTLLLPFIDGSALYASYNFAEPWDGPGNIGLSNTKLQQFVCPRATAGPTTRGWTNYVFITGPGTAFPDSRSTSFRELTDGPANTILLAEIAGTNLAWAEPRDLDIRTMSFVINDPTRPSISSPHRLGPAIVFADSISAWRVTRGVSPDALRGLVTIAGGEQIEVESLIDLRLLIRN